MQVSGSSVQKRKKQTVTDWWLPEVGGREVGKVEGADI